jgi:hypothetical protein
MRDANACAFPSNPPINEQNGAAKHQNQSSIVLNGTFSEHIERVIASKSRPLFPDRALIGRFDGSIPSIRCSI